ncbi:MAG: DUF4136 domain-containing protein [Novosphingobium sp.]|nr:DUF4136 domain-containing protein [Novosphingobium sp.]
MVRPRFAALVLSVLPALLCGCVAGVAPVEVSRFHLPDTSMLGRGSIAIEPAPGLDPASLELRSYEAAVARQLTQQGYVEAAPGGGEQIAVVRLDRHIYRPVRTRGPVSVGVGGATGSYGSGVGMGVGIDLSGRPPEQIDTELGVMIRDRASNTTLWEGRSRFTVPAKSPLALAPVSADKMATALFGGFPGRSGETIEVK